jgi:glutathione S-transferase
MKLYFSPHACSLAPHIVLRELGLPFELVRVNNTTKRTSEGGNFLEVNPKGYVAALALNNGKVLTEGVAILQFLADQKPEAGLAAPNGTWERLKLQEWLNFITTELHGAVHPLFNEAIPDAVKTIFSDKFFKRLDYVNGELSGRDYLFDTFGIADAYLYTVLTWLPFLSIDVARWPSLDAFAKRIGARDAVRAALAAEAATPEVA